ncbi:hypothetical protein [Streptomyces sp. NPDC001978]|uniref:hypothetical protein n=1 Tax=Streptomyces sp. NPDC001978 TaxID=3364627 RepID=UPI003680AABF
MTVQNPDCDCPRTELTGITLQTDLLAALEQEAASRGMTIESFVESAFTHLNGRVCPCIRID